MQARWIGGSYKVKYHLAAAIFLFLAAFLTTYLLLSDFALTLKIYILIIIGLYLLYAIYMTLKKTYRENNLTLLYLYPIFITVRIIGSFIGVLRQFKGTAHLQ